MDERALSGVTLAYIGDAVFEVCVRARLIGKGYARPKDLNKEALSFVTAASQSAALDRILPLLTEEETDVYRRGRNASGVAAPKSSDAVTYRRATGLEALFGWLYLTGKNDRVKELFGFAFPEE